MPGGSDSQATWGLVITDSRDDTGQAREGWWRYCCCWALAVLSMTPMNGVVRDRAGSPEYSPLWEGDRADGSSKLRSYAVCSGISIWAMEEDGLKPGARLQLEPEEILPVDGEKRRFTLWEWISGLGVGTCCFRSLVLALIGLRTKCGISGEPSWHGGRAEAATALSSSCLETG